MERRRACCSKPNHWLADREGSEQSYQDPRQVRNWLQSILVADTDQTGLNREGSTMALQRLATTQPLISVWMQTGRSHLSLGFPTTEMATPTFCKLNSPMDQPGGLTETVDEMKTKASALPPPPPSLSSPTCQETQLNMPGSSASTGDLSEVVEVHSFDSSILFLVIQSKRFKMIFINFYISREVIAPFNGKPSALIYQEANAVFKIEKCAI